MCFTVAKITVAKVTSVGADFEIKAFRAVGESRLYVQTQQTDDIDHFFGKRVKIKKNEVSLLYM
jgi:hypothetical protein